MQRRGANAENQDCEKKKRNAAFQRLLLPKKHRSLRPRRTGN
jgi:hypothetical protein